MKLTPKQFFMNILNGMAAGIVVAFVPNAMLGELFKYLAQYNDVFIGLGHLLIMFQFTLSLLAGITIGAQFKFSALQTAILSGASLLGSGALQFNGKVFQFVGIGDLINMMLTIAISAAILIYVGNKMGSLNIVFLPLIAGIFPGFIGSLTLPYVKSVTGALGKMIEQFTELNPLMMCILIGISFSLLMATPISLVAIATVISLSGLGSGAANLGIVACCYTFIFGSLKVNDRGTVLTLIIGAAKMMMPVYFKYPIIALPLLINGFIAGLCAYFFNVQGTPMSAGFGYTGLVGPINALRFMEGSIGANILSLLLAYVIIPLPIAFMTHIVLKRILRNYNDALYKFTPQQ
ncbi:PTS transporter subunit IIC [Macrococcus armenti]|uniref:PTS sugar transporter subunit IIC n=1 Tax=Macrococcus armenti TaxID=2875764 RepID=A0ABY3ZT63_9STAP|nr:PTS sugar transporter subunit IIC [Macrococcus armenti]UOB20080.1 PTS sugar transporter subunit IIC [Macrococcus armenti]